LLEVIVAMVVGLVAIATARAGLLDVLRAARALPVLADERSARAAHGQALRAAIASVDPATDTVVGVRGDSMSARLPTWCTAVTRPLAPCVVTLTLRARGSQWELRWLVDSAVKLREDVPSHARLAYLERLGTTRDWVSVWRQPHGAPLALALVADGDTVILGRRGLP
jgi:hypothetical protein